MKKKIFLTKVNHLHYNMKKTFSNRCKCIDLMSFIKFLIASVNIDGNSCPPALRLIACLVLYEITAFLRETYQTLPKTSKMSTKEKAAPWERVYKEANRRWSMALSSMGHSQTSAQSLQSIAGGDNERKISFVLHEPDNESENSSNTTVTMQGEESNNAPVNSKLKGNRLVFSPASKTNYGGEILRFFSYSTKTPSSKCSAIFITTWNTSNSSKWRLFQKAIVETAPRNQRGQRS